MLTIIDAGGFLHLIPRERLVNISMLPPEPAGVVVNATEQQPTTGEPAGTKMKLLINYETGTGHLGQLLFFFTDDAAIARIKEALRMWAAADSANQLVIDAGRSSTPAPEITSAISIG